MEDARSIEGILDVHSIPDLNPRTEEAVALLDDPEYTLDVLAHGLQPPAPEGELIVKANLYGRLQAPPSVVAPVHNQPKAFDHLLPLS